MLISIGNGEDPDQTDLGLHFMSRSFKVWTGN